MMTFLGPRVRACDGVSRRSFLRAGSLAAGALSSGALTLPALMRAEAAAGIRSSRKSVINVHLDGGPPHMDMIDLKPDAPVEIRGEFRPIATNLAGFQLCEHMPRLATIADRFVFIRSLVGAAGAHNAFQCQSGYFEKDLQFIGGRPAMGSVLSKLHGPLTDATPTFVDLMQGRPLVRNSARPGFLGPTYQPFRPDLSQLFARELEAGMQNELKARGENHATKLSLLDGLSAERLRGRTSLLSDLDTLRREVDAADSMQAMDSFWLQAVDLLTSGRFAEAMDLKREDARGLEKYRMPGNVPNPSRTSEGPEAVKKFLLARRLVEAGVRCVSLTLSDFDTHADNFPRMKSLLPVFDHGLWALVTDLEERGMLDDVSIVVWGEFGRTPKVDAKNGGRHHWPAVGMAMLAGGGMRTGQVLGATDKTASAATDRPIHYQDVFATLYENLGLDSEHLMLQDQTGRPQILLDVGKPITEVLG